MAKAGKTISLKRSQLVSMFLAIGIDIAPKWTVSRLQEKTVALSSIVDEDTKVPAEHQELFDTVLKIIEKKLPFTIEDDGDGQAKSDDKPAKSKKAKKEEVEADSEEDEVEDDEDDSDDEDEDEDEDEEPKAKSKSKKAKKEEVEAEDEEEAEAPKKKKGKAKKEEVEADDDSEIEDGPAPKAARKRVEPKIDPKTPKKSPGVISIIVGLLKEDFVSKEDILKRLCKEFPDREESAMKQTVNTQIPSRLKQTYCLQKSDGKFRIVDGKAGLVEVDSKPAKAKKPKKEEVDDEEDEVEEAPKKKKSKK
jgi:hypothetical protein